MKKIILLSLLSATALTGCARAKEELGITRRSPDEFAIVKRAPLEMPPNLNQVASLPAPQPGAPRPQETSPEQTAKATILGIAPTSTTANAPSSSETALLQKAGAAQASSNIRATVDKEAVENADKNRPVVKRIMNWGNTKDEGSASVVDAPEEADRIKQKKTGETPTIDE